MQEPQHQAETQTVAQLPQLREDDFDLFPDHDPTRRNGSVPSRKKNSSRGGIGIVVLVVLLIIVLGGGFFLVSGGLSRSSGNSPLTFRSQVVVRGNLSTSVSTTGAIQGTIYNADFSITGKISEIDVSVGQRVNAGQVLAKLDTSTLPSGANTADAVLTAPHAGTITAINGTVGGSSSVGNATTHFIQMVDSSTLQMLANVNEADISQVAVNERVQFTVTAYGAQQFYGTVSALAPQGQSASNVVTYPVTITVDMTRLNNAKLLSGMTANVQIITVTRTNVLLIPVGAVTLAEAAQTLGQITSTQVSNALSQARQQLASLQSTNNAGNLQQDVPDPAFVLEQQNNQLIPVPVVLGLNDGQVYEVLSGLSEGETILTASTTPNANQGAQGTSVPGTNSGKGGL